MRAITNFPMLAFKTKQNKMRKVINFKKIDKSLEYAYSAGDIFRFQFTFIIFFNCYKTP